MTEQAAEPVVRNNPDSRSYDAVLDGAVVGTIAYARADSRIIFRSTVVRPEMRGRGIGAKLVKAALDDVRAQGARLTSLCSFVDDYIDEHPEYADLLDAGHPGRPHDRRG
jgi:uncharacterized protein